MNQPTDGDKRKELQEVGSLEDLLRKIIHEGALSVPPTGRCAPSEEKA
tara:strand:+ start:1056 stop:1199 length:144 start_codon:yes stop_codon:yes gene_type:complete